MKTALLIVLCCVSSVFGVAISTIEYSTSGQGEAIFWPFEMLASAENGDFMANTKYWLTSQTSEITILTSGFYRRALTIDLWDTKENKFITPTFDTGTEYDYGYFYKLTYVDLLPQNQYILTCGLLVFPELNDGYASVRTTITPEPATILLLGLGLFFSKRK